MIYSGGYRHLEAWDYREEGCCLTQEKQSKVHTPRHTRLIKGADKDCKWGFAN